MLTPELIQETLNEVLEKFLKPKFIDLGMNASGDWLNSLQVRVIDKHKAEILGLDYTRYLVNGRKPGKPPPIAPIIRWVGYKFGYSGKEAISTAYAVRTKIAQSGTSYFPDGTELLEVLQSKETIDFINHKIKQKLLEKVKLEIIRIIEN